MKKLVVILIIFVSLVLCKYSSLSGNQYTQLSKGASTERNSFHSTEKPNSDEEITSSQITVSSSCRTSVHKDAPGGLFSINILSDQCRRTEKAYVRTGTKNFSNYLLFILPFHSFW